MFKINDRGIIVNSLFPNGFEELCVVVDVSGGLMKYGECDYIKSYYMELMKMYSNINKSNVKDMLGSLGFNINSDNMKCDILFINIKELEINDEYKVKFMNYMINHSLCGKKIKELLEGFPKLLEDFLDSVE